MRAPASAGRCGSRARSQSAGRGRRGSAWVSPPGNLYASLLLSEPSPEPLAPQLSFVAALALHDALVRLRPRLGPLFKLQMAERSCCWADKLAGILIEGESEPAFAVVIGIGVNCASHPPDTAYPGDRSAAGRRGGRAGGAVCGAGGGDAAPARRSGTRGDGFAAIRADWLARAAGLGEDIRVRLPEREFAGRFRGARRGRPAAARAARRRSRPSPPAKCFGLARNLIMAQAATTNWYSRRSAASARSA